MALLLSALLAGCGSGGGGGSDSGGSGTLGVSLTDSPACGFDAVNVTVVKVRVHQSNSASDTEAGWSDITLAPARKINLLDLNNGVLFNLGETTLPAGHYTQLRLVLDPNTGPGLANSVVPTGGVETGLVTPSAVQSGIKLINEFDVASGQRVDLALDFDACKSVVKRGNGTYALKPVIKVVPFVPNGIKGFVNTALLGSAVMITAQQDGVVVQSTAPIAPTGEFFLARLAPGNYDVVFTANDRATAVIATVPVASTTSVVALSSSGTPISLLESATRAISGTASLNPTSSTAVVDVAAKQTFGLAPIVTVKSVLADELASGAYSLTLPTGAPQLGQYSATLPIGLVAQAGVAGKYTIESSATGYQTQSAAKDLSTTNATQNFTLVTGEGVVQAPVGLGLAGNYAIFANTGISNATTPAAITGDIGVGPGVTSTAITGFALTLPAGSAFATSAQVTGKVYAFDYAAPTPTNVTTASADMGLAYTDAAGRTAAVAPPFLDAGGGSLGGLTLAPGVYTWGSNVSLPFGTNVTLSGGPDDVWIFQIAGTLTTGAATQVLLSGGARAKNIFWQVAGSSVTLGATSHFEGVVLAKFAINFGNQASANSRLLAQTAVNLDQNAVTQPAP